MSIRINVIDRKGNKTAIDVEENTTIRDAIMNRLSPDKYGICDGNCLCGTCHVYVNPDDFGKLNAKGEDEIDLLNTLDVKIDKYSRLGCQIELKKEYDNITVSIV